MVFQCCGRMISSESDFRCHMKTHSDGNSLESGFKCPICAKAQNRKDNYVTHLKRKHSNHVFDILLNQANQPAKDQAANDQPPLLNPWHVPVNRNPIERVYRNLNVSEFDNDVEMHSESDQCDSDYDENDIPSLEKEHQDSNLKFHYDVMFARMMTHLKTVTNCAQKSLNIICAAVLTFVLSLFLNDLLSAVVIDELIKISKSTVIQESKSESLKLRKHKDYCFYYTDLKEIAERYLTQPEICRQLFYEKKRKKNESVLTNINDTGRYQAPRNVIKVLLNLYWDDYDIKQFSKSSSFNTKMSAVYVCIGNINYQYQSKRDQISLLGIGRSYEMENINPHDKREGVKVFFQEIKRQLTEINQNPFEIKSKNGEVYKCEFEVCSIVTDNLAMSFLMDLPRSFSNTRCCQFCTSRMTPNDATAELRSIEALDHMFKDVPFNGRLYVADIFHDLNEGSILKLMDFILLQYTPSEVDGLQDKIDDHKNSNSTDLPTIQIKNGKAHLKGTGSQIMNFFMIFPFINTKLTVTDTLYKQYLVLRKIVNFVMRDKVIIRELAQFDEDVEEYIRLNTQTNQSYTLKIHHLTHYSMLMREFGPLMYYSTLRFERVHQIGKSAVHSSRNRQNLAFSVAKAYVRNVFSKEIITSADTLITRDHIATQFEPEFHHLIDFNQDCTCFSSTIVGQVKLKTDNYYLYKTTDESNYNFPIFFYCQHIIKQERTRILGYLVYTETFDRKNYAYLLKNSNLVKELDVQKLPYYKKLNFIVDEGIDYICKDFHISYDSICYQV